MKGGNLVQNSVLNIGYTPLIGMLRKVYGYEQVQGTVQPPVSDGTADGQQMKNGGPERPPPPGRAPRQVFGHS